MRGLILKPKPFQGFCFWFAFFVEPFVLVEFIDHFDEFYGHKGLDKKGNPKPKTLKRLGLENEPSHVL